MPVLVGNEIMFSFVADEPLAVSQYKIVLRREARKQWPFLTPLDLSEIGDEHQLVSVVNDRTGGQQAKVATVVHRWVTQHRFHAPPARPESSLSNWENEGGAKERTTRRIVGTIGIRA
jgi:hypothetical protein